MGPSTGVHLTYQGPHPSWKLFLPRSHRVSVAPQLGLGALEVLLHARMWTGLVLCMQQPHCCVPEGSSPIASRRYFLFCYSSCWLTKLYYRPRHWEVLLFWDKFCLVIESNYWNALIELLVNTRFRFFIFINFKCS